MDGRDIIVIGASAGGVTALETLAAGLPADLPAAVMVALHLAPGQSSTLPRILDRAGPLRASHADDGEAYERGRIYVAPPDHHLLVRNGRLRLTRSARENLHRPAIDPLFRSAAVAHGPRVIGVVLTGELDDGTAGLSAVKRCGGTAVVQDPRDAAHPSMPQSALKNVAVDHCVPVSDMAALLAHLAGGVVGPAPPAPATIKAEDCMIERQQDDEEILDRIGSRSTVTCPECNGTLWELSDDPVQFRCHVGHAYSPRTLMAEHTHRLEDALWAAVRHFEESASLSERVAARYQAAEPDVLERLQLRGRTAEQHARELRKLIDALPVED
jgi:two-component system, chemotaxis family, protein-glutamate methylesterase/glutaminase